MGDPASFKQSFKAKTGRDLDKVLKAEILLSVWNKTDDDGNGYIEGSELDEFLKEFVSSVCSPEVGNEVVSEAMLLELKRDFLDAYDDNGDGKIEVRELAQLLPTDENFLLLFQLDNRLSSSMDFMKVWRQFDQDGSGSIDAQELGLFLKDLLGKAGRPAPSDEKLREYTDAILRIFDENKDGKLQISEMARLLPVKEKVISSALVGGFMEGTKEVSYLDIENIFAAYDADKSGSLEGEEIEGFAKDMLEAMKPNFTSEDLALFKTSLLAGCDLDGDGGLCREELTLMLLGLQKFKK